MNSQSRTRFEIRRLVAADTEIFLASPGGIRRRRPTARTARRRRTTWWRARTATDPGRANEPGQSPPRSSTPRQDLRPQGFPDYEEEEEEESAQYPQTRERLPKNSHTERNDSASSIAGGEGAKRSARCLLSQNNQTCSLELKDQAAPSPRE